MSGLIPALVQDSLLAAGLQDSLLASGGAVPAEGPAGLTEVTVLFTLALALSLVIERILEILKAFYDLIDSRLDWYRQWTVRATRLRDFLERRLRLSQHVSVERLKPILDQFSDRLLNGQGTYPGTLPVISGDLVRASWVRAGAKAAGVLIGIGLAYLCRVDLLSVWQNPESVQVTFDPRQAWLSGVAIGLGSGIVHKLITTLERKRDEHAAKRG
jgi:hypothetical protein